MMFKTKDIKDILQALVATSDAGQEWDSPWSAGNAV